jgi:hypothetical protein
MEEEATKDGFLQTKDLILGWGVTKVFIRELEDAISSKVSNAAVNSVSKSASRSQEGFQ